MRAAMPYYCVILRNLPTRNCRKSTSISLIHARNCYSRVTSSSLGLNRYRTHSNASQNQRILLHSPLLASSFDASLRRNFHLGGRFYDKDSSTVESAVKELKYKKEKEEIAKPASTNGAIQAEAVKTTVAIPPKRRLHKRIWDELVHYWHGFRLLYFDTKTAYRLTMKRFRGEDLTRREYRQLTRTVSDLFRLLPFSVFIIVPFMEFLLPVVVKLFPGMLPSTFETSKDRVIHS